MKRGKKKCKDRVRDGMSQYRKEEYKTMMRLRDGEEREMKAHHDEGKHQISTYKTWA